VGSEQWEDVEKTQGLWSLVFGLRTSVIGHRTSGHRSLVIGHGTLDLDFGLLISSQPHSSPLRPTAA